MNNEKYLKVFNDLLLNDKVDDDFKSILYGLIYNVNKNPDKLLDMAYIIRESINSYNLSKIDVKQEEKNNESQLKTVDWSCFFYGNDCYNSYFGSYMPTEIKNYGFFKVFGRKFGQIYKSTDGKIHLKYQPNFLTKEYGALKRFENLQHYIELVLTDSEIQRIKLTEEDDLFLENKKHVLDEIQKNNNFHNCKITNMKKIFVTLDNKQKIDDLDIEFVKILIDFKKNDKDVSSKTILNILNGNKSLNVSDLIYMYNVFKEAGHDNIAYNSYKMDIFDYEYVKPTPVTVKTSKCKRINWQKEDSWIEQIDDIDYLNAIMINSSNLFLENKYSLNLDIDKSFASSNNIEVLKDFLEERGIYNYTNRLNAIKQKVRARKKF